MYFPTPHPTPFPDFKNPREESRESAAPVTARRRVRGSRGVAWNCWGESQAAPCGTDVASRGSRSWGVACRGRPDGEDEEGASRSNDGEIVIWIVRGS